MSFTIENVTTATKLGSCALYNGTCKRLWNVVWDPSEMELVKSEKGRIYLIVSRANDQESLGEIKKIGKSECKGGMKKTFAFYQNGISGSPSIRTFGIHHLITAELKAGKIVEIWGIWSPQPIEMEINGLLGTQTKLVYPSIHIMEELCRIDYKNATRTLPPWNFQERGQPWPDWVQQSFKQQVAGRGKNQAAQ